VEQTYWTFGNDFARRARLASSTPLAGTLTPLAGTHAARPVHQIISMMKWIRTSRLSIKNSLPAEMASRNYEIGAMSEAKRAVVYVQVWHTGYGSGDSKLRPATYTLHPTPYTLHPIPYTLHPTPYTLHPTPYTLHLHTRTLYTLHPTP